MSTRGMVAIQWHPNGSYSLFYRHTDTYPTSLGTQLMELLRAAASFSWNRDRLSEELENLGLRDERKSVGKPEEVFLSVQGDLDWVYAIELGDRADLTSLTIFKTSNPSTLRDFAFRVWFGYVEYFPNNHFYEEMLAVERCAGISLSCVEAYANCAARSEARPLNAEGR